MKLSLTDDWRIESDPKCWILQRHSIVKSGERKGQSAWENKTYHSSLEDAINHVAELYLRESKTETLSGALEEMENITTALSRSLTPRFKVTKQ